MGSWGWMGREKGKNDEETRSKEKHGFKAEKDGRSDKEKGRAAGICAQASLRCRGSSFLAPGVCLTQGMRREGKRRWGRRALCATPFRLQIAQSQ